MDRGQVYEVIEKRARERYPDEAPEQAVAMLMEGPDGRAFAALYEQAEPGGMVPVSKADEDMRAEHAERDAAARGAMAMVQAHQRAEGISEQQAWDRVLASSTGQQLVEKARGRPAELPATAEDSSSDELIVKAAAGEISEREAIARMIDARAEAIARRHRITKAEAYERMESDPEAAAVIEKLYAAAAS